MSLFSLFFFSFSPFSVLSAPSLDVIGRAFLVFTMSSRRGGGGFLRGRLDQMVTSTVSALVCTAGRGGVGKWKRLISSSSLLDAFIR